MRAFFHTHLFALALALALALTLPSACDDGGAPPPDQGTITLGADQGISFTSGLLQDPGNFKNSDIYVTANGSALKLATGGPNSTINRPANWFLSAGGIHQTFASLADVPDTRPSDEMSDSLVKAKTGNGFVVATIRGDFVRGWLEVADATSVTIQWERLE